MAPAAVAAAPAVAAPLGRGNVHRADYRRDRCLRGGVSRRSATEKHCACHRTRADCAGGDAAG